MSAYTQWKPGTTYNLSTKAPGVLPSSYQQLKLSSICNFRMAQSVEGPALYAKWRQIYPLLPAGTPDRPEAVDWYVFETASGSEVVLAADWINGPTVTPVTYRQYSILLTDSDYEQAQRIRDFLNTINAKFTITEHTI